MSHNTYRKADGTVGVGFMIQRSGRMMHSIAWPNDVAERMMPDEMERKHITCKWPESESETPEAESEPEEPEIADPVESAEVKTEVNVDANIQSESSEQESETEEKPKSEAEQIREYLTANPDADNKTVIEELAKAGTDITSSQVTRQRKNLSK
jgi:hypothetical protein